MTPDHHRPDIDVRALRRQRNRAAPRFDAAAVLAGEIAGRMLERLALVRPPAGPVLDLGCATGAWMARLREARPEAEIFGVDIAERLLVRARERAAGRGGWWPFAARRRGGFACAEAGRLPFAPGTFAMIWSNQAAHWLRDPQADWRSLGTLLRPGGLLMFSTLGPDTLTELREASRAGGREPGVHRFADMHDVGDALVHAGFEAPVMDMERITLTYDDFAALVADLRDQGAMDVRPWRPRGLLTPRAWARVAQAYERHRREGRLPATFEVVYGHAWWPVTGPRHTADGLPVVQLPRPLRPRNRGRA